MRPARTAFALVALIAACRGQVDEPAGGARAAFTDANGNAVGTASLSQQSGGVEVRVDLNSLPAGEHGFHIHATGKCEPPFQTAGPHFNPENRKHGKLNPEGAHMGDLDNIPVAANGRGSATMVAAGTTLEALFDDDGSAFVVHAAPDDYQTDPAGNAGARIACGVIRRP